MAEPHDVCRALSRVPAVKRHGDDQRPGDDLHLRPGVGRDSVETSAVTATMRKGVKYFMAAPAK